MESILQNSMRVNVNDCVPLLDISLLLRSPAHIFSLLRTLDKCRLCSGNPDIKFRALAKCHQGKLMDHSGMCVLYKYIYMLHYVSSELHA